MRRNHLIQKITCPMRRLSGAQFVDDVRQNIFLVLLVIELLIASSLDMLSFELDDSSSF
jgi:hypothetical protein